MLTFMLLHLIFHSVHALFYEQELINGENRQDRTRRYIKLAGNWQNDGTNYLPLAETHQKCAPPRYEPVQSLENCKKKAAEAGHEFLSFTAQGGRCFTSASCPESQRIKGTDWDYKIYKKKTLLCDEMAPGTCERGMLGDELAQVVKLWTVVEYDNSVNVEWGQTATDLPDACTATECAALCEANRKLGPGCCMWGEYIPDVGKRVGKGIPSCYFFPQGNFKPMPNWKETNKRHQLPQAMRQVCRDPTDVQAFQYCTAHSDCSGLKPLCKDNYCQPCEQCQFCMSGIDKTCGPCDPIFELPCHVHMWRRRKNFRPKFGGGRIEDDDLIRKWVPGQLTSEAEVGASCAGTSLKLGTTSDNIGGTVPIFACQGIGLEMTIPLSVQNGDVYVCCVPRSASKKALAMAEVTPESGNWVVYGLALFGFGVMAYGAFAHFCKKEVETHIEF